MPPDAQGEAVDANNLPQAAGAAAPAGAGAGVAPQHPVWAAASGRGGGASKPKQDSMFKPISMMELEIRGRGDLDGGSSTASMRGGYKANGRSRQGKRSESGGERKEKKRDRPREYDDDDEAAFRQRAEEEYERNQDNDDLQRDQQRTDLIRLLREAESENNRYVFKATQEQCSL